MFKVPRKIIEVDLDELEAKFVALCLKLYKSDVLAKSGKSIRRIYVRKK